MKDAPSIFAFLAITGDLPTFCFRLQIVELLCSSFFSELLCFSYFPPKRGLGEKCWEQIILRTQKDSQFRIEQTDLCEMQRVTVLLVDF